MWRSRRRRRRRRRIRRSGRLLVAGFGFTPTRQPSPRSAELPPRPTKVPSVLLSSLPQSLQSTSFGLRLIFILGWNNKQPSSQNHLVGKPIKGDGTPTEMLPFGNLCHERTRGTINFFPPRFLFSFLVLWLNCSLFSKN